MRESVRDLDRLLLPTLRPQIEAYIAEEQAKRGQ